MESLACRWPNGSRLALSIAIVSLVTGCYAQRRSSGGQQADFSPPRRIDAGDVAVPDGYLVEVIATGLTFPTGVTFDDRGAVYVVESGYAYGEKWTAPRLLRVARDRAPDVVAEGGRNGPWTGVAYANGAFYVAEGGALEGGKLLRIARDGTIRALVEGLPSQGDHHTNGPAVGPDGWIYFGQGVATNSGVVGEDSYRFGWLARRPDFHDIPCKDVTLTGENFRTENPLTPDRRDHAVTGAFLPFGTPSAPGQRIPGNVPCSGAILRVRPDGGAPQLVAWGLRNPFGLAFSAEGRLYVTDNGYDERGSRPLWGTPDLLWAIESDTWYGWPDYSGALEASRFDPPGKPAPRPLLRDPPGKPPRPVATFDVHGSANGFDFSRSDRFGHVGQIFLALFGDMTPGVGKLLSAVGFKVVRVDPRTGVVREFMVNRGKVNGPGSKIGSAGLERPVAARFDPDGTSLYVVDFGVMVAGERGPVPYERTGVLWRIRRAGS